MNQNKTAHLAFLDAVRGVAVMLVFATHAYGVTHRVELNPFGRYFKHFPDFQAFLIGVSPFTLGYLGVAVFFAVSGFCIHLSCLRKPDMRDFFIRRIFRIYPPYLFFLIFFAFIFPITRTDTDGYQMASHLLLFHNLDSLSIGGINGTFWSIAVEFQLYLLYPVLVFLVTKVGWGKALWGLGLAELTLRTLRNNDLIQLPFLIAHSPFIYWFSWTLGAYTADCFHHDKKTGFEAIPTALIALLGILLTTTKWFNVYDFTIFSFATCVWIARQINSPAVGHSKIVQYFNDSGKWSYTIYLLHYPLLVQLAVSLKFLNNPMLAFILCSISWVIIRLVSKGIFKLIEIPGQDLGKKICKLRHNRLIDSPASPY